jgi:hypothetical protein
MYSKAAAVGFTAAWPRVLAILRDHHTVDTHLHRHGLLWDHVRLADDSVDDRATLLVARRHRARQPPDRRVAQPRRADFDEQIGGLLLRHARERARRNARQARCVGPFDHAEAQIHGHATRPRSDCW